MDVDAYIGQNEGRLDVHAPAGGASEIAAVYRDLAARCIDQHVNRVLLRAVENDSATERALRDALALMLLAGMPAGFRIAIVAATPLVEARYRSLRQDLRYLAIEMEFFAREDDAVRWLGRQARFAA